MRITKAQREHEKRNSHVQVDASDPHNLDARFVSNHLLLFEDALKEIQTGAKRSCWLWFVLPTAPHVVDGIERGSAMNQHFALRGDDAVKAYLRFERKGVNLRRNYIDMMIAVREKLQDTTMLRLFGPMDVNKAISSFQLFRRISEEMGDMELMKLCQDVLAMVEMEKQNRELSRVRATNRKQYRHIMTL